MGSPTRDFSRRSYWLDDEIDREAVFEADFSRVRMDMGALAAVPHVVDVDSSKHRREILEGVLQPSTWENSPHFTADSENSSRDPALPIGVTLHADACQLALSDRAAKLANLMSRGLTLAISGFGQSGVTP